MNHPPTAVIFNNPKHKRWTAWDYKLVKAHFILDDWFRDGVPVWWDESDRVSFDAKPRVSKSRAAIERKQEAMSKRKNKSYGVYFVAEPRTIDGGPMPTKQEWIEEEAIKQGNGRFEDRGPSIVQGKK